MVLVRGGITVKPHVQRFADAVVAVFGASLSPGTYPDHSPPEGPTQALDLFTPDNSAGYAMQADICAWIIKNQAKYNVRYCIRHNPNGADWIWNIERAAEGWRAMATNDHRGHVHVTFYADDPGESNPPTPNNEGDTSDMFTYSTAPNVDGGSIWLVTAGFAYRMHRPEDVQRLNDKGVLSLGQMSESFHNVFQHRG